MYQGIVIVSFADQLYNIFYSLRCLVDTPFLSALYRILTEFLPQQNWSSNRTMLKYSEFGMVMNDFELDSMIDFELDSMIDFELDSMIATCRCR